MNSKRSGKGLLTALRRPLAALGRLMGSSAPVAEETIALPAETRAQALVDDSFTMALDGLLTEDDGRFQTKLHLISLVEFHEAVGDKWSRVADKVMLIAEGVINLHLGAGNVYGRKGPDLFVLVFRNTPPAEARRRAVRIAQELGTRLVGSQFTGHDRPLALAAEITLADAMDETGALDLSAINAAVSEMRAVIAAETGPTRPSLSSLPQEGGARRDKGPDWTEMEGGGKAGGDPKWKTNDVERSPGSTEPGLDATPPMPGDAALSLLWRPTWLAEGEVIGGYRAQVQRMDRPGETAFEGCRAYPPEGGESALMLDRFTAGAAVRGIKASQAEGGETMALVPLHWASMDSAARMSVLAPFADIPEAIRNRRLVIELFGLPDHLTGAALGDAVTALRPLCRDVMVRVGLSTPALTRAAQAGCALVGLDLAELVNSEKTDDDHLLRGLGSLRDAAAPLGLKVCVWGVRRRKVVVGTILGDFAMMNGPGLMKDIARPARILPAPRSRFAGGAA
ncbi:MAG: hypothetical protein HY055_12495 [Magnetospirillum sp.]|nr:hypothetical protein [Magnetospirillum sp.]